MSKSKNEIAFSKAMHFCAYQERPVKDVLLKLHSLGLNKTDAQHIVSRLIEKDYINEERFARVFAGGKFRLKKWGKIKIAIELKAKGLSDELISKGIEEIDDKDYINCLEKLIQQKVKTNNDKNDFIIRNKVSNYLVRKGYEPDLIWELIQNR